ncbi:S-layer family protein [Fontibacillus phaseoli]|uniref:S-layer family protein n=1 Tax=Fontibacillus phaseoli TaxID=1416533 RepID=A0A369B6E6_9BACL|nr:protease complex subunit PrcB family protein [Fontibacillus phaseoli]RCX17089.1 S-layer family protein [Fontibacillus phaseoli]
MKNTKIKTAAALLLSGSLLLASSASAFSDVQGQDAKITESLQQKGIIQGISKDKFVPRGKLTGAQGVYMILNALGLQNKNDIKPFKNDHGKNPWYTSAQKAAEEHGIKLPDNFKWNSEISKEQFAYILDQAISATGNYPMIKMYIEVKDADKGNVLYSGSIQRLLLMKITELDDQGKFYPTATMTRIEAARIVYNAAEYVEKYKENEENAQQNVSFTIEKVNDQINKVVLTRYEQPHPGYGIRVAKVEFTKENKAIVYYELLSPEAGKFYPQVITDSKTETYVSSNYTVEIAQQK